MTRVLAQNKTGEVNERMAGGGGASGRGIELVGTGEIQLHVYLSEPYLHIF